MTPDDRLVVAVSGGLDSTTLLHLLRFGVGHRPDALVVAHFDHGMRTESDRDAAWVRGLARAWRLEVRIGSAEVPPRGEGEARALRWQFLEEVCEAFGARAVVTAHHRDDQVETVLHNLMRGTGLRGIAAMDAWSEGRLRPLLAEPRQELRGWAVAAGLAWREDPTNALPAGPRNRLRNEVLPLLETIRPGASAAIARSAQVIRLDEEALAEAEERVLAPALLREGTARIEVDLTVLQALPDALLARLLRRLARRVGARLDRAGTRAALAFTLGGPGGGECRIPPGVVLRRSLGALEVEGAARVDSVDEFDRELRVSSPRAAGEGTVVIGGEHWRVRWGDDDVDADWVADLRAPPDADGVLVRGWRDGDRLDGIAVSRLWSEAGVPLHHRHRRPVVEDGDGRLLWVPGSARTARQQTDSGPLYRIGVSHVDQS